MLTSHFFSLSKSRSRIYIIEDKNYFHMNNSYFINDCESWSKGWIAAVGLRGHRFE